MSYKRLASVGPIIGLLMFSAPLWAHHGNAAFDTSKRVTVKGNSSWGGFGPIPIAS